MFRTMPNSSRIKTKCYNLVKNEDFDQRLKCAAPKGRPKCTTEGIIFTVSTNLYLI